MMIKWRMILKPSRCSLCKGRKKVILALRRTALKTLQYLKTTSCCCQLLGIHVSIFLCIYISGICETNSCSVTLVHVVPFSFYISPCGMLQNLMFSNIHFFKNLEPEPALHFFQIHHNSLKEPSLGCPNVRHAHTNDLQRRSVTLDLGLDTGRSWIRWYYVQLGG